MYFIQIPKSLHILLHIQMDAIWSQKYLYPLYKGGGAVNGNSVGESPYLYRTVDGGAIYKYQGPSDQ